jgi:hypothetical protein
MTTICFHGHCAPVSQPAMNWNVGKPTNPRDLAAGADLPWSVRIALCRGRLMQAMMLSLLLLSNLQWELCKGRR